MNSSPDPLPTYPKQRTATYPTRRLSQILCFVGGGCGPVTIMSVKLYLLQVVLVCTKALGRTVQYVLVLGVWRIGYQLIIIILSSPFKTDFGSR